MNIDFYQQYKDYSNTELLKIVNRPANYQPNAVAIATQILNERQVTTEEIQSVEQYFEDIDHSESVKNEKIAVLKSRATDFLEPVLQPGESVQPNKWINILLLVIAIQYVWSLFKFVRRLIGLFQCDACSLDITVYLDLLTLLYVPVIFFLLIKRRRWGWILLFADNLVSLISSVSQSYLFFKYQSIHQGNLTSFLLPILINTLFVVFMWSEPIVNYFKISYDTKKKTALITTVGTLLFVLIMYLIYSP